jgi:hypothetical protein
MMPPETGLPLARSNGALTSNTPQPSVPELPATRTSAHEAELEPETLHG